MERAKAIIHNGKLIVDTGTYDIELEVDERNNFDPTHLVMWMSENNVTKVDFTDETLDILRLHMFQSVFTRYGGGAIFQDRILEMPMISSFKQQPHYNEWKVRYFG